jgi:uncharacterized protein YndB with AHSA1/START domain
MSSDQQSAPAATVTTPSDRQIRVEREFAAPREAVFAAMTDPELIPEWWGPHGTTTVVDEMDLREGGRYRFVVRFEGREDGFRGEYREITPPERLVLTFEWEGLPGHVCVEEHTLEDLGDATRLVTVSTFDTTEDRDGMLNSMQPGMDETYARLDELLARRR